MKSVCRSLPTFLLALLPLTSPASDLSAPIDFPSAKVLPQGVRNLRYKGVMVRAEDKYDNGGEQVLLANPLFSALTFSELSDPQNYEVKGGQTAGYVKAIKDLGFQMDDNIGETTGAIKVGVNAHVPVVAYGFTPKLTVALAVPVMRYQVMVDTSIRKNEKMEAFARKLREDDKQYQLFELEEKINNAVNVKAERFGYHPLANESGTRLGDMKLVFKYQVVNIEHYALSLQNDYTLPTGKKADINKVVDVPGGDGQTDVGFGIINDFYATPHLTFTAAVNYLWQLPDTEASRIPYREDKTLTDLIDEKAKRDLGDQVGAQLATKYEVFKGVNVLGGYGVQYKARDSYKGTKYEPKQYIWKSANTIQRMQTAQAGIGYTTLPLFQEKKFPVPLEANLNYTKPVSGKNISSNETVALEFVMYF